MFIYLIWHKPTGKCYVGQTVMTVAERMCSHRSKAKNAKKCNEMAVTGAIRKHGWGEFDFATLEQCSNQDELNEAERYWINHYDCLAPHGYNIQAGGTLGPDAAVARERRRRSAIGRKLSDETKRKISEANAGRVVNEEVRAKLSAAKIGSERSEETKEKIRTARQGAKLTDEAKAKLSEARKAAGHARGSSHPKTKLTEADVIEIRRLYESGERPKQLALLFDLPASTVSNIVARRSWAYV